MLWNARTLPSVPRTTTTDVRAASISFVKKLPTFGSCSTRPTLSQVRAKIASRYKLGPIFTPPPVSRREGPIGGFRSSGGTNWPGGSFDPETHIAYVPSFTAMPVLGLLPPPNREFSDLPYVSGNALTGVRYISGPGENVGADARPAPAVRGNAPILYAMRQHLRHSGHKDIPAQIDIHRSCKSLKPKLLTPVEGAVPS